MIKMIALIIALILVIVVIVFVGIILVLIRVFSNIDWLASAMQEEPESSPKEKLELENDEFDYGHNINHHNTDES